MSDVCQVLVGGNAAGLIHIAGSLANRHGLVSGATGTGKTVTLQTLAEGFSRAGVPVFLSDAKGDLSGLAKAGERRESIQQRVQRLGGRDFQHRPYPVILWDLLGENGHPVRATISDMGPLLLATLLNLNNTQSDVLQVLFRIADDQGLLLLDLKDLKSLVKWAGENAKSLQGDYGSLPTQSLNAIQRSLLSLEEQGGDKFFAEPALQLNDLMQTDFSGNGVVSLLDASRLIQQPRLYAMFMLWLLAELFEQLPEVGDQPKPRLVFFFDEAHLLFDNAPVALLEKLEQVVRLIRSKGVGIYFITQHPQDIPEAILGQLAHRVQHALRAFTPKDQKALKVAAQTFRRNENLDTETVIGQLGIGEALVSVLDHQGVPTPVQRVEIAPPQSRIGPMTEAERSEHIQRSPLRGRYDMALDRVSAYEVLKQRSETLLSITPSSKGKKPARQSESVVEALAKSAARAIGSQLGRQIVRGVLGSLLGKR